MPLILLDLNHFKLCPKLQLLRSPTEFINKIFPMKRNPLVMLFLSILVTILCKLLLLLWIKENSRFWAQHGTNSSEVSLLIRLFGKKWTKILLANIKLILEKISALKWNFWRLVKKWRKRCRPTLSIFLWTWNVWWMTKMCTAKLIELSLKSSPSRSFKESRKL